MVPSAVASVWMSRNHPDLLRERLKGTFQEAQPARAQGSIRLSNSIHRKIKALFAWR